MNASASRIVSLLPAATEIVCALGQAHRLAGISHQCDYPESVMQLPVLTRTRPMGGSTNAAINDGVRDIVERGLALYLVDADRLREIDPAIIITQTQCHLCAVSPDDLVGALSAWTGATPDVVSLEAMTLEAIYEDVREISVALGCEADGSDLIARMRQRMDRTHWRARACDVRPRVGVLEWLSPLMAGGNWMPELLRLAGCEPVWGEAGAHSPWLTEEQLLIGDPDILLVIPCGYGIAEARAELAAVSGLGCWPELTAVRLQNVFICDGNAHFNRPGPRITESLEIVFDIAHGSGTENARSGHGWERVN